eukprot:1465069-Rhodomonas_salina.1
MQAATRVAGSTLFSIRSSRLRIASSWTQGKSRGEKEDRTRRGEEGRDNTARASPCTALLSATAQQQHQHSGRQHAARARAAAARVAQRVERAGGRGDLSCDLALPRRQRRLLPHLHLAPRVRLSRLAVSHRLQLQVRRERRGRLCPQVFVDPWPALSLLQHLLGTRR